VDIVYTNAHLNHAPVGEFDGREAALTPHPDVPSRAEEVFHELAGRKLGKVVAPEPLDTALLHRVHSPGLTAFLREVYPLWVDRVGHEIELIPHGFAMKDARLPEAPAFQAGYFCTDAQTPITSGTWAAALSAASCAATGADRLLAGSRRVFAVCRPPGHHAGRDYYGGYCYLNNAAVAAQRLLSRGTVAVLDVDYHHGNGTQDLFYENPSVFFVSVHADPGFAYPYFRGYPDEKGVGKGSGYNLNLPFPRDVTEAGYFRLLERAMEKMSRFRPDFLVVSLGLDTMRDDPLGGACLEEEGYFRMGRRVAALKVPVLVVLEGGYCVEKIGVCAANVAQALESETASG
jgi:acetoin utilization deacetylase AcuC-like enzyme